MALRTDLSWICYRKRCLAPPPQRGDGFLQPVPADVASGDVEQPQTRHGERRGEQLGEETIAKSVAGEPQLGDAGLKLQRAEEWTEGGRGQTQTGGRHGRAGFLNLTQPGDVFVLLWEKVKKKKKLGANLVKHRLNHQLLFWNASNGHRIRID